MAVPGLTTLPNLFKGPAGGGGGGPDITTGLLGWWKLDEGAGASAADSSGSGNGGTVNGSPTWGADYLQFDGTDDLVEIANESAFDFENTDEFTVAAWLYFSASGSVITKQFAADGWTLSYYSPNGEIEWQLIRDSYSYALTKKFAVPANTWVHVVCTYDGSNTLAGLKCYLDGVEASPHATRNDWGTTPSILTNTAVRLGADEWDWVGKYAGRMRHARIYNRALTAEEAEALYEYAG
jgi:hypothetical protein